MLDGQPTVTLGFGYDAAGNRTSVTWPDGFVATYAHDAAGRVIRVAEGSASSGPGVLATYSYDALGRRIGLARAGGAGAATTYGYDGVGRLSSLGHDVSGTAADLTLGFGYSPASQVISRSLSNDAYAYGAPSAWVTYARNGLNQYTAVGGVWLAAPRHGVGSS